MGYPEQDHLNSRNGLTGLAILNLDLELLERSPRWAQGSDTIYYFGATMESWWPGAESTRAEDA